MKGWSWIAFFRNDPHPLGVISNGPELRIMFEPIEDEI